jgi:hypothetical protein
MGHAPWTDRVIPDFLALRSITTFGLEKYIEIRLICYLEEYSFLHSSKYLRKIETFRFHWGLKPFRF